MIRHFLSIKWKLTLALIALSVGVVLVYITVAKTTFENDKIAYVFETQQNQLNSIAKDFNDQVGRSVFVGRNLLGGVQAGQSQLNDLELRLFHSDGALQGLKVFRNSVPVIDLSKEAIQFPSSLSEVPTEGIRVSALSGQQLLLSFQEKAQPTDLSVYLLIKAPQVFPELPGRSFLLLEGQNLLTQAGDEIKLSGTDLEKIQTVIGTGMVKVGSEEYLVSRIRAGFESLDLVTLTPKEQALGALDILYRKSLIFLALSAIATFLISLLLAKGLTSGLKMLTRAAKEVGEGKFDITAPVTSRDEVGVLSEAFQKMTLEIKRLLLETAEKARMAAELETARAVQETLFPEKQDFRSGDLNIWGEYRSASECGGDWWWCWQRNEKLYVLIGDVTGHGASAALLTSAARAALAAVDQQENFDIQHLAKVLNIAILECSRGQRNMSCLILEVDPKTKFVRYINASHLPALVLPATVTSSMKWSDLQFLDAESSPLLGTPPDQAGFKVGTYQMKEGDRLLLLTDGLVERRDPEDQMIRQRSFYQNILRAHGEFPARLDLFVKQIFTSSDEFAKGRLAEDDLTVVAIENKAA